MPMFLDIHKAVEGLTAKTIVEAHKKDIEIQSKYGVKYIKYWYSEKEGAVFCLSEAPSLESALRVHKEAHGLIPDDIIEVVEGG